MKPVEIEFLIKNGTKATLDKISSDVEKLGRDGATNIDAISAALENSELQVQTLTNLVGKLEDEIKRLSSTPTEIDQSENIAQIELLTNKVEELKVYIKQLEETAESTQVVPTSLPTAKRQFDGLHFSIQQMAREMPTLAMGPQMFFLAISNNLPIFTDELARAKKEYAALTATGEKGTPVWKQVVKSLFSWQTAMTTGIMLLVMYGDEIIKSISGMTGWGEAARKKKEAAEELIEAEKKMVDQAAKTITEFEALSRTWSQLGNDLSAKATFIEENSSAFDKLGVSINSVAEAENLLISNKQAFIEAQFAKAESVVLAEMAAEKYKAVLEKQETLDKTPQAYVSKKGTYTDGYGTKREGTIMVKDSAWQEAEDELAEAEKAYEDTMGQVIAKQGKYAEIFKNANFNAIEDIKEGTVAWYEEQMSLKQKQLKTLSVSDKEEIDAINKQIAAYQAVVDSALGKEKKDTSPKQTIDFEKELQNQRFQNQQSEIDLMADGSDKKIAQIKLNYTKEIAEIAAQEKKWREAQKGELTEEQSVELNTARSYAKSQAEKDTANVTATELAENKKKIDALLEQYQTLDQKRKAIDSAYAKDKTALETELKRLQDTGEDITNVEASLSARETAYKNSIKSLQSEIVQSTEFYNKLFSSFSDKGYTVIKDFYKEAKNVIESAVVSGDSVTVAIPELTEDGSIVEKQVKVTVAEYQKMVDQLEAMGNELEKDNPFKTVYNSFSDMLTAIKEGDTDAFSNSMSSLQSAVDSTVGTMSQWGDSLETIFGDTVGQAFDEIVQLTEGVLDFGIGVGQIASGDIVGGITSVLSGIASVVECLTSWRDKEEEQQRSWYLAELEVNRLLEERNYELAESRNTIADILADTEALAWLVENGFATESSSSEWSSAMSAFKEANSNLESEMARYEELWDKVQSSNAEWSGKSGSLSWYSITQSLKGMTEAEIELYYQQGKLSDSAEDYYEAWVASGESIEELIDTIDELYASMREMVMGVSFDSWLSSAASALQSMQSDISALGDFTEETLTDALLNAFMYQRLAEVLEPLYNELSDALIDGSADADFISDWKEQFEKIMSDASDEYAALADAMGITSSTTQSGNSGSFSSLTYDQGTKLEGLFTAAEIHLDSIDDNLVEMKDDIEEVSIQMSNATGYLKTIADNTTESKDTLKTLSDTIKKMISDGLKIK